MQALIWRGLAHAIVSTMPPSMQSMRTPEIKLLGATQVRHLQVRDADGLLLQAAIQLEKGPLAWLVKPRAHMAHAQKGGMVLQHSARLACGTCSPAALTPRHA